mmetsp:Transcript_34204/g.88331  ORF Transcript_34204/g.88331 Transcript_34204/m.88331 type:complete len:249 (-) Transcript_34204:542-1288(-)
MIEVTGVQAHVANVIFRIDPRKEPINTKTVASVRTATVLPLVNIPVVFLRRDALPLETLNKFLFFPNPHTASNNFSYTWHKQITALRETIISFHALHVERLLFSRESTQENRLANHVNHLPLGCLRDVITKLVKFLLLLIFVDLVLLEEGQSIGIVHPAEGPLGNLKLGVQLLEVFTKRRLKGTAHDTMDQRLDSVEKVIKGDEGKFRLQMSILSKMATGSALFSPERRHYAKAISDSGANCFKVELA